MCQAKVYALIHDHPSDCRLLINEVGDHRRYTSRGDCAVHYLKRAVVKDRGIVWRNQHPNRVDAGVDIKLQNKPSINYDNTTTVVEQHKQDRKVEVGSSYEQNIVADYRCDSGTNCSNGLQSRRIKSTQSWRERHNSQRKWISFTRDSLVYK